MMSTSQKVMKGAFWQFNSQFTIGLLQIVVIAILARFVSAKQYGIISIVFIVYAFVQLFSTVGIAPAIIQRKDLSQKHIRAGFWLTIILGAVCFLIILVSAPAIGVFFKEPSVVSILRVFGTIFIIDSLGTVSFALLERNLQFKKILIVNVVSSACGYALVSCTTAIYGLGAWSIVAGTLSQYLIRSAMRMAYVRHSLKFYLGIKEIKDLVVFGTGQTFVSVFNTIALKVDNFIVGKFLGATNLGFYNRAFRVVELPHRNLGGTIDRVMFPAMSGLQNDIMQLRKVYLLMIGFVSLIMIPLTGLMIVTAEELVQVLLGARWITIVLPIQILVLTIFARTSVRVSDSVARATGHVYRTAWRKIIYAISMAILCYLGHFWGIIGVAWGVNAAVLFNYGLITHLSHRILRYSIKEYLSALLPGVIWGGISATVVFGIVQWMHGLSAPPVLTLIFAGCGIVGLISLMFVRPRLFGSSWVWFFPRIILCAPEFIKKRIIGRV